MLEGQFPETTQTQPELLAHHYAEAGLIAQAIPYWQWAGQKALERSANSEVIGHLTKALELLKTLPDTPERIRQELDMQIILGPALIVAKGWSAPEVRTAYARAQELCQQVGEPSRLSPVLWGLWVFYHVRGEHQHAREFGEQLLRLAQRVQDSALLVEAHTALGYTLYCLGEFTSTRELIEQGLALYDPQRHRALAFLYGGSDPGMASLAQVAWILWMLGYPDQALQRSDEAVALARELAHPHSLTFALGHAAVLHQFRREAQAAQERAEGAITFSTEQGFPFWLAWGTILRGWALAEQGQIEEGINQIRQGLAAYWATGAEVRRPHFFTLLAEAYGKVGQAEEILTVVAEALALVDKTGERYYEAELYRLKGELLLAQEVKGQNAKVKSQKSETPDPKSQILEPQLEAEACFLKAIKIAQLQQAKSLELRAVMSLARLRQQQVTDSASRTTHHAARAMLAEAHTMLSEIYNWFTEGFNTKDLQEAKTLIEELSQ